MHWIRGALLAGGAAELDCVIVDPLGRPAAEDIRKAGAAAGTHRHADRDREPGPALELVGRAQGGKLAFPHDRDAVGPGLDFGQHVGGEDDGRALVGQLMQRLVESLARFRVEPSRGLVQDQQPGRAQDRLREAQALAHALGVGLDPLARDPRQYRRGRAPLRRRCGSPL